MKLIKATLLLLLTALALHPTLSLAETYQFDKDHTFVTWSVDHFGFSNVTGKFFAEGSIQLDKKNIEKSSASITVNTANIQTGIAKLDGILAGRNFFDTSKYATASFKTTKIIVTGKDTGKIHGVLTIRDVSKDIVLTMQLTKQGDHPFYHKPSLGFRGIATIKRSDFGLNGYIPGVSDETQLAIEAEALLVSDE